MNINNNRKSQKSDHSFNDKITSKYYSSSGKIKEKFIMFNNEKSNTKENKIKELEIIIKNTKIENKIPKIPKSNGNSKLNSIQKSKKTPNKEPYLKPKFCVKNKNSFSIKHKNKNLNKNKTNNNNTNDEINNIYLNFFKVYYDENGKKIKIIKNKSNYKKNKSKEIVLTQKSNNKNIRSNTNIINYNINNYNNNNSNNNYINKENNDNNKLKKNYNTDLSDSIFSKKKDNNKNNLMEIKYFYPDTPSQSTATDNKSIAKSGTVLTNKDDNNNNIINPVSSFITINKDFNMNEKNNIIRDNIYYDNLPLFLKKRNILKKNDKKYKKKNIDKKIILNKADKISMKESVRKLNTELSQGLLKTKFNDGRFTMHHKSSDNNEKDININLNSYNKNILKNDINLDNRINYFHNDISNLTLNMTFEQNNITNTINTNPDNSKIKNIYISSFKKRNMKKELHKLNPLCLNNKLENIEGKTRNIRHSIGLRGNYILFNYYRDQNSNIKENNSRGYQNMKNYNSNLDSKNNSLHDDSNLSYNRNNIIRYKSSNYFNTNAFINSINENEISILNKTKEILKINDDENEKNNNILLSEIDNNQNDNNIISNRKTITLNNSYNYLDFLRNSFFENHKNKYNEKIINIPNIEYYSNAKTINEISQQNIGSNFSQFSKIKRPCSLYINKKLGENDKINKRSFTLSDYYNNAIDRDTHLNMNLNNNVNNFSSIYDNNNDRNKNYQYKRIIKNNISNNGDEFRQKQFAFDKNKTLNNNTNNRFINLNQNDDSQQLINRKINNIFKFNRNKYFIKHSANSSLNFIPSAFLMNKNNIINDE